MSSTNLHDDGAVTDPSPRAAGEPAGAAVAVADTAAAADPSLAEARAGQSDHSQRSERAERGGRAPRRAEPDAVSAAAVDLARASAEELADPGTVGEYLGVSAEGDRLVMHSFACTSRGYRGWRWAVTVARAPRSRHATVCEVVLLPGPDAVLPPVWLPWSDRLAPGDLGPGDELPYRSDDPYLDPGYTATGEDDSDQVALWELGLGRARVLGRQGRDAAADRWYRGSHGPTAEVALHASASCSTCGYLVHIAGALRQAFGVCANDWSPSDGQVVSLDHGCGAHSETDAARSEPEPLPAPILDEAGLEPVVLPRRSSAAAGSTEGTVSEGTVSEGTVSEGTVSEGTVSEGTGSEGTGSEGTGSEGTAAEMPPPPVIEVTGGTSPDDAQLDPLDPLAADAPLDPPSPLASDEPHADQPPADEPPTGEVPPPGVL